jgi:hypothetical protein
MAAYIYLFALAISFVVIWVRHFYLVYKLNIFMLEHHGSEWKTIKEEHPNWFGIEPWPSSVMFTFYSRAAYKFIWRSEESFGDQAILRLRRKIRRFIWELPLYFVVLIASTLFLILTGILK